jgi:hypothetical protein
MGEESTAREPTVAEFEEIARAAARDVARLLDRRGLKEVVALARRVLRDAQRRTTPIAVPRGGDS